MKKRKLITITCVILICVLAGGIIGKYAKNRDAEEFYSEFWEDPSRYDVWMMGSSHTYHAVYPMKIYENYGITSYDFCAASAFLPELYWMMMCAFEEDTPEMIVLDVFHAQQEYAITKDESKVKSAFDAIPLSKTKVDAINDLLPNYTTSQKLRMMFPWTEYMFKMKPWKKFEINPSLGCRFKVKVTDMSDLEIVDKNDKTDTDAMGFEYLYKIIDECNKRGVKLVFTAWPCPETEAGQKGQNAVRDIAKEYNIPFLEAEYEDGLMDYTLNFADHKNHLNISGAKKTTAYLGDYLSDNYDLAHPETVDKKYWEMATERYRVFVGDKIRTADDRRKYLMWLTDDAFEVKYFQSKDVELPEITEKLLGYMSDLEYVDKATMEELCGHKLTGHMSAFVVKDKVLDEVIDTAVFDDGKRIDK